MTSLAVGMTVLRRGEGGRWEQGRIVRQVDGYDEWVVAMPDGTVHVDPGCQLRPGAPELPTKGE